MVNSVARGDPRSLAQKAFQKASGSFRSVRRLCSPGLVVPEPKQGSPHA